MHRRDGTEYCQGTLALLIVSYLVTSAAPKNGTDVPQNSMELGDGAEKDIHQWEQDQPTQQVDTIFQDGPDEDDDLPSPAPSSPMSEYRLRLHDVETQSIGSQSRVKARIVAEKV